MSARRDHGGNLTEAMALHGGAEGDWLDLSTGINLRPYPVPALDPQVWSRLPDAALLAHTTEAARAAYGAADSTQILPVAGAQAAIQLTPMVAPKGTVHILGPTYNEHAAAFRTHGHQVRDISSLDDLPEAPDTVVLVNPNNPTGTQFAPDVLLKLARRCKLLIVDESFCDVCPEVSLTGHALPVSLVILRSFGKFYGLAGLRLGMVLGNAAQIDTLGSLAGPWAVNGPALAIGAAALADRRWADQTRNRLRADAARLDALAIAAGWSLVGGCDLFRTYETPDAARAQSQLARAHIWSRIFPYSETWVRLGLPDGEENWSRLASALAG